MNVMKSLEDNRLLSLHPFRLVLFNSLFLFLLHHSCWLLVYQGLLLHLQVLLNLSLLSSLLDLSFSLFLEVGLILQELLEVSLFRVRLVDYLRLESALLQLCLLFHLLQHPYFLCLVLNTLLNPLLKVLNREVWLSIHQPIEFILGYQDVCALLLIHLLDQLQVSLVEARLVLRIILSKSCCCSPKSLEVIVFCTLQVLCRLWVWHRFLVFNICTLLIAFIGVSFLRLNQYRRLIVLRNSLGRSALFLKRLRTLDILQTSLAHLLFRVLIDWLLMLLLGGIIFLLTVLC